MHRLGIAAVALAVAISVGCDSTPTAPSACASNGSLSAQIDVRGEMVMQRLQVRLALSTPEPRAPAKPVRERESLQQTAVARLVAIYVEY